MSKLCAVDYCRCVSDGLCYVCNQSFCREHFVDHDHSVNFLLKSLNEKVKDFDDRLEELNNEELIANCYEQLDKWRENSYQAIDRLYKKKCEEMKECFRANLDRRQERINELQIQISDLLDQEDVSKTRVDFVSIEMESLEEEMKKLEETIFHLHLQPLLINKNSINIEQINTTHFNFTQLTHPYHSIPCSTNLSKPLASNEEYLLIYRMQTLSLLNRQLISMKQISWSHGRIWNSCWSSTLNRFLLIGHYQVYSLDVPSMSIERMQTILRRNWWACTCSQTSLYLSTYEYASSIMQFRLQPSIQLIKEWKSPQTCSKDECIKDIVYNNETLALIIDNRKMLSERIELRSIDQFDCLWTLKFDLSTECHNTLRCSSLPANQWLVTDFTNQRLFHIRDDGKLQTTYPYPSSPSYLNLFTPNILVIATDKAINFHKL